MTNDYKDKVLKYLTGNLEQQEEDNTPQFGEVEEITNNLKTFVTNNIQGTWSASNREFIQGKDGNGNDLNMFILRGTEYIDENNSYGFLVILDTNMQPIQFINRFTSNVRIGEIKAMKIDNTGSFYMVEHSVDSGKWRLVLLNNILMKLPIQETYFCKIRTSYNIPNSIQQFSTIDIFKSVSGSNYGLICNVESTPEQTNEYLIFNNLKIEVGMSPEWTEYTKTIENFNFSYLDGYWSWDSEGNYIFQAFGYNSTITSIQKYYLNNNSVSVSNYDVSSYFYNNGLIKSDVSVVNDNLFYIGLSLAQNESIIPRNQKYIVLKCLNESIIELYQKENITTLSSIWDRFVFYQKNGIIFFREYYPIGDHFNLDVGLISNDNVYYFTIENITSTSTSWYYAYKSFVVTIQFNLIKYYIPSSTYESIYVNTQIYNQYNYNGTEYENINSLVPQSAILFSDDDEPQILFARNLYNLNINGNTTVSTIEVPNTALNDVTILNKSLYSQTNTTLAYDITPITKNIYEVLDINFFNTLIMKNSNNTDNETINNNGATRLNTSMSQILDYSNIIANKIRINYSDDTSTIQNIGTPTITNNVATYTITIYVPKEITNIEIISNDENTSYQTITGTFDINKYYTLTQDVRVE
jgi:hypothetical protein